MAISFLDAQRRRNEALAIINSKIKDQEKGGFTRDERYWQPVVDKAGNGSAIIRFLPGKEDDGIPFIRKFSHAFQGPGGWYIELSRTTLGPNEKDPVSEFNSELWNSTTDDESPARKQARKQKRKLGFVANILVVKHPGRPEDEGKVFLYEFGKKIFDKINDKMSPREDLGDEPMNPFDMELGANFRLRIKKVGDFRNYDDSSFDAPSSLGPIEVQQEIFERQYELAPEIAPDKFKSYEELRKKLVRVLKLDDQAGVIEKEKRAEQAPAQSAPAKEAPAIQTAPSSGSPADEDDGDEIDFFKKLASGK